MKRLQTAEMRTLKWTRRKNKSAIMTLEERLNETLDIQTLHKTVVVRSC